MGCFRLSPFSSSVFYKYPTAIYIYCDVCHHHTFDTPQCAKDFFRFLFLPFQYHLYQTYNIVPPLPKDNIVSYYVSQTSPLKCVLKERQIKLFEDPHHRFYNRDTMLHVCFLWCLLKYRLNCISSGYTQICWKSWTHQTDWEQPRCRSGEENCLSTGDKFRHFTPWLQASKIKIDEKFLKVVLYFYGCSKVLVFPVNIWLSWKHGKKPELWVIISAQKDTTY